jgi:hypothetical protein
MCQERLTNSYISREINRLKCQEINKLKYVKGNEQIKICQEKLKNLDVSREMNTLRYVRRDRQIKITGEINKNVHAVINLFVSHLLGPSSVSTVIHIFLDISHRLSSL